MDKVKAIKELERFSLLLVDESECLKDNFFSIISFAYDIEFLDVIAEAVEALRFTEKIGKCKGCISSECEFCARDKNRHDMYQDRW